MRSWADLKRKVKASAVISRAMGSLKTEATTVSGVRTLAMDGRVPPYVKKLIEGYDLRVFWFELFVRRPRLDAAHALLFCPLARDAPCPLPAGVRA